MKMSKSKAMVLLCQLALKHIILNPSIQKQKKRREKSLDMIATIVIQITGSGMKGYVRTIKRESADSRLINERLLFPLLPSSVLVCMRPNVNIKHKYL